MIIVTNITTIITTGLCASEPQLLANPGFDTAQGFGPEVMSQSP